MKAPEIFHPSPDLTFWQLAGNDLTIMSLWTVLWIFICVALVAMGFCWRMGYELRKTYKIFPRFRCFTLYGFTVNLGDSKWSVARAGVDFDARAVGSYPRILQLVPLVVVLDSLDVHIRDDREILASTDDMLKTLNSIASREINRVSAYARQFATWSLHLLHPSIRISRLASEYMYEEEIIKSTVSNLSVDIMKGRAVCEAAEVIATSSIAGTPISLLSIHMSPVECFLDAQSLEVSSDTARFQYSLLEPLVKWLDRMSDLFASPSRRSHPSAPPALVRINWLVRHSVELVCESEPLESVQLDCSLGCGMFVSLLVDATLFELHALSFHNLAPPNSSMGRSPVKSVCRFSIDNALVLASQAGSLNVVLDMSERMRGWTTSMRAKTGSVFVENEKFVELKSVAINGSSKSGGVSVFSSQMDLDASERLLQKLARNYNKIVALAGKAAGFSRESSLASMSGGPDVFPRRPATPLMSDLNFMLLRHKYKGINESFSDLSNSGLKSKGSSMSPAESFSDLNIVSMASSSASKSGEISGNWRSVERMMMQSGRTLFHIGVDKVVLRTGVPRGASTMSLSMQKLKVTSKTSSLGSPFTNITADVLSVDSNIVSSGGGFRFWIDGALSAVSSRVFCLIPPIEVRFDPEFAASLETYFLQVAGVLKLIVKSGSGSGKFVDFLQISSLQLELHAREMLGVLSLDNAVIKLNRSSVYKSHGLADALDGLAAQYKEEIKGQWLNLVMHLDVAIGRPVSTAKRLLHGIIGAKERR